MGIEQMGEEFTSPSLLRGLEIREIPGFWPGIMQKSGKFSLDNPYFLFYSCSVIFTLLWRGLKTQEKKSSLRKNDFYREENQWRQIRWIVKRC
jgi:hypothetical protein